MVFFTDDVQGCRVNNVSTSTCEVLREGLRDFTSPWLKNMYNYKGQCHKLKRCREGQLNRNSNPPSVADLSAVGIRFAHAFAHLDLEGYPRKMIVHLNSFSFHQGHVDKQLPLFFLNANVLCACFQRESFLSIYSSQSVSEKFGACVSDWRTSFNTPATTLRGQRPRWRLDGNPTK